MSMEKELIKYILELVGDDDLICDELHKNENEHEYCFKHCHNLNENCVRRLMYDRMINKELDDYGKEENRKCENANTI